MKISFFLLTLFQFSSAIWPQPKHILRLDGNPIKLSQEVLSKMTSSSSRLNRAIERFVTFASSHQRDQTEDSIEKMIESIEFNVKSQDTNDTTTPGLYTNESYEMYTDENNSLLIFADTIYGAMYSLETLSQLIDLETGMLLHSNIHIKDEPQYAWRGLMIDSGRRFVNVATMKNLLDTMAATKLNVLHLHASDFCRFGVESKIYPNLTESLTGIHGGFYTQNNIVDLIAYASDRGIRIVPEFDIPGHSRGFMPVESQGLSFCDPSSDSRNQLHGTNGTFNVLKNVLGEMSKLFTDEVFNIGSDETSAKGTVLFK